MSNHHPELRAPEAARTIGMGLTAFNLLRDQLTRHLDPHTGLLSDAPNSAEEARSVFLVAPALGGYRRPRSDWRYTRTQVERYASVGLAAMGQEATRWVVSLAASLIGEPAATRPSAKNRSDGRNAAKRCDAGS